jgi:prepilin-type N-terminal cleavage/methylation domain-containing protein
MYRGEQDLRRIGRTGERGFSLTEMLIIIVMLGILAALAFPRLDYVRYRVNSDTRNVMMTLAYGQRLAVSLQHNVQVTFDATNNQMRTLEDKNDDGNYTTDERIRGFSLTPGVVFDKNAVPDLPSPNPTNQVVQITFYRDGSANSAGVVFLNSSRGVAKATNEDARAITITRATGRPTWFTYTGGYWRQGT